MEKLFNEHSKGFIGIMDDLSKVNRKIALQFDSIYSDSREIEDDFDYMEAQKCINAAIVIVGQIMGRFIAEDFF
jgi:hypothetical protein